MSPRLAVTLAGALLLLTAVPGPAEAQRKGKGSLEVTSLTKGAEVYVDDELVGTVPLAEPIAVEAGQPHTIRIQKRGFRPWVDTVTVKAGQSEEIEADLVPSGGVVRIKCNILRAQVLIDGKQAGLTPFDGDVPPGKHLLQVVAAGYQHDNRGLEIEAGKEIDIEVNLKEVPPPLEKESDSILARWWFWGGVGAAVVTGVTIGVLSAQVTRVQPAAPMRTISLP